MFELKSVIGSTWTPNQEAGLIVVPTIKHYCPLLFRVSKYQLTVAVIRSTINLSYAPIHWMIILQYNLTILNVGKVFWVGVSMVKLANSMVKMLSG